MQIRDMKVGARMALGFGVVLALMLATIIITFWSLRTVDQNTGHVIDESLPFTLLADQMVIDAIQVQQFMTDASATHNVEVIEEARQHYLSFKSGADKFKEMFRKESDNASLKQVDALVTAMDATYATGERMVYAYIDQGLEAGNRVMTDFDADTTQLAEQVKALQQSQITEIQDMSRQILLASEQVKNLQYIIGAIALALGVLIATYITRSIVKPLALAVGAAKALSVGDLTVRIDKPSKDETGQLLQAMQQMIVSSQQVVDMASKIAAGHLDVNLRQRSEHDFLIQSLAEMVAKLKEVIGNVKLSVENVASGAQSMSASSEEMSQGATEQAAAAEEASSSVEQMN
ncbi:MAG: HAMP domain-containing protein, partial [Desulfuromonadales bacterium]|nr:HAMP domain-containing protein [Desulfuromonadales bacterium]